MRIIDVCSVVFLEVEERMAKRRRSSGSRVRRGQTGQAPPVDFNTEYHYVLSDLKRLAIVAAALFVLLIALALIF